MVEDLKQRIYNNESKEKFLKLKELIDCKYIYKVINKKDV